MGLGGEQSGASVRERPDADGMEGRAGSGDLTPKTETVFVAHLTKGSPCTATSPFAG